MRKIIKNLLFISFIFYLTVQFAGNINADIPDCEITYPNGNAIYLGQEINVKVTFRKGFALNSEKTVYRAIYIDLGGGWITVRDKDKGPSKDIPINTRSTTEWIFNEATSGLLYAGKYGVDIWKNSNLGKIQVCGPQEFYVTQVPTPTAIPPTPPPGVIYTPVPTKAPEQCPRCSSGSTYSSRDNKCCDKRDNLLYCIGQEKEPSFIICSPDSPCSPGVGCGGRPVPTMPPELEKLKKICDNVPENEKDNCIACTTGTNSGGVPAKYSGKIGSYTAIGCLPTDLSAFFSDYLWPYGLGIAGGIAFLLMLWGAFNILVSMGDAKKIEHGRELIVSAITGLLFIIFAVLILHIIGVDTLKIPGFE